MASMPARKVEMELEQLAEESSPGAPAAAAGPTNLKLDCAAELELERLAKEAGDNVRMAFQNSLKVLIVGGAGEGKSTMIEKKLNRHFPSESPETGRNKRGVTKRVFPYLCTGKDGADQVLIDTPGVGDVDVTVPGLIARLSSVFDKEKFGGIDAIVVTQSLTNCERLSLNAQIVKALVDQLVADSQKGDKSRFDNVIFCGTKKDRAADDFEEEFEELKNHFFDLAAVSNARLSCHVSKDDYSQLDDILAGITPGAKQKQFVQEGAADKAADISFEYTGQNREEAKKMFEDVVQQQREEWERSFPPAVRETACSTGGNLMGLTLGWMCAHMIYLNLGAQFATEYANRKVAASSGVILSSQLEIVATNSRALGEHVIKNITEEGGKYSFNFSCRGGAFSVQCTNPQLFGLGFGQGAGFIPALAGIGAELGIRGAAALWNGYVGDKNQINDNKIYWASKGGGFVAQVGTGAAMGSVLGPWGTLGGAVGASVCWLIGQLFSAGLDRYMNAKFKKLAEASEKQKVAFQAQERELQEMRRMVAQEQRKAAEQKLLMEQQQAQLKEMQEQLAAVHKAIAPLETDRVQ